MRNGIVIIGAVLLVAGLILIAIGFAGFFGFASQVNNRSCANGFTPGCTIACSGSQCSNITYAVQQAEQQQFNSNPQQTFNQDASTLINSWLAAGIGAVLAFVGFVVLIVGAISKPPAQISWTGTTQAPATPVECPNCHFVQSLNPGEKYCRSCGYALRQF